MNRPPSVTDVLQQVSATPAAENITISLADDTILTGCRWDLLNLGDLMGRGWSVIPLKPKSKIPAVRWQEYQQRFATLEEMEAWFTTPGYNIGIVTGSISKLFVIDIDTPEAVAWAESTLPPCDLRVRTAKGEHRYYPYSGERPMRNKVRVKHDGRELAIDIRAEGGYVVGPGSVHESGHVYQRVGAGWRWS
jgi:hypothetical protein